MPVDGRPSWIRKAKITIFGASATPDDYLDTDGQKGIEIGGGDDPRQPGLRIQYKITKTSEKEPNTGEVTITNLSPVRRGSLQAKGGQVLVEAGYAAAGVFRAFLGDVRTIDHVRVGADWETRIKMGDGERSYQYARVSESFAAGTTVADILTYLANKMGIGLGNLGDQLDALKGLSYDQGYAVHSTGQQEIDRLLTANGLLTWSIQDGELQLLPPEAALALPIPLISPTTGLIGSPEMGSPDKKSGATLCKFKALLTPTKPGRKVKLQSERYPAPGVDVLVKRCEFSGDTRGGDWYTTFDGEVLR